MTRPVIGINTCLREDERRGLEIYLYADYADAIEAAGGAPVLLPPLANQRILAAQLRSLEGLLLTGGNDPDSRTWDEALHPRANLEHPRRDAYDRALCRAAVRRKLPVLGICSGAQTISIALGGSLHQHIYDAYPRAVRHHGRKQDGAAHRVRVAQGTRLAQVLGAGLKRVNSSHHQSVNRLGRGLRVSGVCPDDGVVEAIEHRDPERWVIGVQWHPETLRRRRAEQRLFESFMRAAGAYGRCKA